MKNNRKDFKELENRTIAKFISIIISGLLTEDLRMCYELFSKQCQYKYNINELTCAARSTRFLENDVNSIIMLILELQHHRESRSFTIISLIYISKML